MHAHTLIYNSVALTGTSSWSPSVRILELPCITRDISQAVGAKNHGIPIEAISNLITLTSNPQVLYSYPPGKPVSPEVVSFCFPHDVQPKLLERTPSMSALNELVYSQRYQRDDAVSFVFLLKVRYFM